MKVLTIDVVSDVVCPWCLIGITRLERALEAFPDLRPDLRLHPYLLDPSAPDEGVDLRAYLRAKYGRDPEGMFATVEAAARETDIPLDFSIVRRGVPTARAHVLLRHARSRGTQWALGKALLEAYFLVGEDVSRIEVLTRLARAHGFEGEEAYALLRDETELRGVRDESARLSAQGIDGVPFFLFAGSLGVSGAQRVETFERIIARALSDDPT